MAKKFKINAYKIKRITMLLILVFVLFFFWSLILKRVSPVFKPPTDDKVHSAFENQRTIKIERGLDYQNPGTGNTSEKK